MQLRSEPDAVLQKSLRSRKCAREDGTKSIESDLVAPYFSYKIRRDYETQNGDPEICAVGVRRVRSVSI